MWPQKNPARKTLLPYLLLKDHPPIQSLIPSLPHCIVSWHPWIEHIQGWILFLCSPPYERLGWAPLMTFWCAVRSPLCSGLVCGRQMLPNSVLMSVAAMHLIASAGRKIMMTTPVVSLRMKLQNGFMVNIWILRRVILWSLLILLLHNPAFHFPVPYYL